MQSHKANQDPESPPCRRLKKAPIKRPIWMIAVPRRKISKCHRPYAFPVSMAINGTLSLKSHNSSPKNFPISFHLPNDSQAPSNEEKTQDSQDYA